jgi:hypothetical protein
MCSPHAQRRSRRMRSVYHPSWLTSPPAPGLRRQAPGRRRRARAARVSTAAGPGGAGCPRPGTATPSPAPAPPPRARALAHVLHTCSHGTSRAGLAAELAGLQQQHAGRQSGAGLPRGVTAVLAGCSRAAGAGQGGGAAGARVCMRRPGRWRTQPRSHSTAGLRLQRGRKCTGGAARGPREGAPRGRAPACAGRAAGARSRAATPRRGPGRAAPRRARRPAPPCPRTAAAAAAGSPQPGAPGDRHTLVRTVLCTKVMACVACHALAHAAAGA